MYDKRIKIPVILSVCLLLVCLLRLTQMQLLKNSFYRDRISELKRQRSQSRQLKTIRGRILDRDGRILAVDQPQFQLCIDYRLSCFMDERIGRAKLLRASKKDNPKIAVSKTSKELENKLEDLLQIVDKSSHFGLERPEIEDKIKKMNNRIWDLRTFQAWRQNRQKSNLLKKYKDNLFGVRASDFITDLEKHIPDPNQRLVLVSQTDIAEMHKSWPLLELKTDDDIFAAQLEFMDVDGIRILPKARRFYPYGPAAAQQQAGSAQQHSRQTGSSSQMTNSQAIWTTKSVDGKTALSTSVKPSFAADAANWFTT